MYLRVAFVCMTAGLTDLNPASLQLIALNVAANKLSSSNVSVGRLRWGEPAIEPYRIGGAKAAPKAEAEDTEEDSERQAKRRKHAPAASVTGADVARLPEPTEGAAAEPVPPGPRGFRLIIASDIIIEDAAIPQAWATVEHYLSEEPGAIFVMTCVERPTLVMSAGIVSEEPVDTTLRAFVDGAAERGFEAGEAPQETTSVAGREDEEEEDSRERVRTFVFCRA